MAGGQRRHCRARLGSLLCSAWLGYLCAQAHAGPGAQHLMLGLPSGESAYQLAVTQRPGRTALGLAGENHRTPWDNDNPFAPVDTDADAVVVQLWLQQQSGDYKRYVNGSALRVIMRKALSHWWYRERHSKFELDLGRIHVQSTPTPRPYQRIYRYWVNLSEDELEFNFKLEF